MFIIKISKILLKKSHENYILTTNFQKKISFHNFKPKNISNLNLKIFEFLLSDAERSSAFNDKTIWF